jgi:glutamate-1-semialdehyde 2,1-aminomutase
MTHALDARSWDLDGNEYIDYVMGHGALLLGHGHPAILDAVRRQLAHGVHLGSNQALEIEWASLIRGMMPSAERIEFFASGQEANLMGIRLARVSTGRSRVVRFRSMYHGWADELQGPGPAGTVADQVDILPGFDLALLERTMARREHAVALVEAGGGHLGGRHPVPLEFYRGLPDICRAAGTVLLLDEVVTGFREGPGGWQQVVGITPDLTTVGKAVSGGIACGVLLGRADLFSPLDPDSPPGRLVVHGGTWNAAPLACAAGVAACRLYQDGAPQRAARAAGEQLITRGNRLLSELGIAGSFYGRSVVHFLLGKPETPPAETAAAHRRLDLHLLQRGVSSLMGEAFVFSAAHTGAELDRTHAALDGALKAMRDEGSLPA